MMRHSQNRNLSLHYQPIFKGFEVQAENGPLVAEYLQRTTDVVQTALQHYASVFAFRLDLRFPVGYCPSNFESNQILERFLASFKAKIRHNRTKAKELNPYARDSIVRYVWCREIGQNGAPHYHLAILLNNDAFCSLGIFELGRENLFNRLHEAWASALGVPLDSALGLVEFPQNPFYLLHRDDRQVQGEFIRRLSYLCKAVTKVYGDWIHCFGTSRR